MTSIIIWTLLLVVGGYASLIDGCLQHKLLQNYTGSINVSAGILNGERPELCYKTQVPDAKYIRIENMKVYGWKADANVKVIALGDNSVYKFNGEDDVVNPTFNVLGDVHIEFTARKYEGYQNYNAVFRFSFNYTIEDIVCAQKNHFRCSPHNCVLKNKVCDKVKDCEEGEDELNCEIGIPDVEGVNVSRTSAISWMKKEKFGPGPWSKNDQRAVTALYLADGVSDSEEEMTIRKLELETSVALMRDEMERVTPNELAMFIQALLVTCRDPRRFYGFDLVKLLREREDESHRRHETIHPTAILALCNVNESVSNRQVKGLVSILNSNSAYAFLLDMQAVALMALTCIRNRGDHSYVTAVVNSTVARFRELQKPDGSFGNIYTTAYLTQAILSSNDEESRNRSVIAAQYLMERQANDSSFGDFLATYLILPILNGKTLVDIGNVNCSGNRFKIPDYTSKDESKTSPKMNVKYSLYHDDELEIVDSIVLRMPLNLTAYQIMQHAAKVYPKYRFDSYRTDEEMYVSSISGIANDPENGKLWLFHLGHKNNKTVEFVKESIDEKVIQDGDHFIMYYKAPAFYK